MEIGYSGTGQACMPVEVGYSNPTVEQRLLQRKVQLETDLKEVNDALEALQANPEIMKVLGLISKVRY